MQNLYQTHTKPITKLTLNPYKTHTKPMFLTDTKPIQTYTDCPFFLTDCASIHSLYRNFLQQTAFNKGAVFLMCNMYNNYIVQQRLEWLFKREIKLRRTGMP